MWDLYDEVISAVLAGLNWFLVRSLGVGVSMRPLESSGPIREAGHLPGMMVRDLATWVKSWNEYEAALGVAAINSI